MPQKQPPAITAVCSPLLLAIGASTAGFGTTLVALSPALQAIAPASTTIKAKIEKRERRPYIAESSWIPGSLESLADQKLRTFPIRLAGRHGNFQPGSASNRCAKNRLTP